MKYLLIATILATGSCLTAMAQYNTNLLVNPGFEASPTTLTGWTTFAYNSGYAHIIPSTQILTVMPNWLTQGNLTNVYNGSIAACYSSYSYYSSNYYGGLYQNVTNTISSVYNMSVYAEDAWATDGGFYPSGDGGTNKNVLVLKVEYHDASTALLASSSQSFDIYRDANYHLCSASFTNSVPPSAAYVNASIVIIKDDQGILLDDASLVAVPPPPTPPAITIATVGGQEMFVSYPQAGALYTLQTATNVNGPWVPATNGVPAISYMFTNSAPGSTFFRLQ